MQLLMAYKVSLILMATLALMYVFQGYYPEFMLFFSNAFPPIIASAAVISSGFSLQKYWHGAKERFSMVWLLFTIGLFLWFMGESIWMGYTLILNVETPYLSVADAFWLAGYIPFFVALYLYVKIFGLALSKRMLILSMLTTVAFGFLVSITLVTPILGYETEATTLIVDLAYPLLDVALLSVALLGLLIFLNGNLGKSWLFINAGILCNTIADIIFSYATLQGTYYSGHPLELLYHFSYLFFLLAFYVHVREL